MLVGVPLKKSKELSKEIEPDIGMFRDPAAQALVERATRWAMELATSASEGKTLDFTID